MISFLEAIPFKRARRNTHFSKVQSSILTSSLSVTSPARVGLTSSVLFLSDIHPPCVGEYFLFRYYCIAVEIAHSS